MITTSEFCKKEYGEKLYKLSLSGPFTCPTRDGKLGYGGCIFCSAKGSGDFAVSVNNKIIASEIEKAGEYFVFSDCEKESKIISPINDLIPEIDEQIEEAKKKVEGKFKGNHYIAYFQAYTSTYAPVDFLRKLFMHVIKRDDIAVLDIATRPDCIPDDVLELLDELNKIKPVWVELGLQTTKEESIQYIRRGYETKIYDEMVQRLRAIGVHTITHVILGLPGETKEDMLETVFHVCEMGSDGIKLQLLHVLEGTDLAKDYKEGKFEVLSEEEYLEIVEDCVKILPESLVVHRLTGDGAKKDLIAPLWSANKREVYNSLKRKLNLK